MKTIDAKDQNLKALNGALKMSVNGSPVKVRNAAHVDGLGAGLKHGEIIVEGDVGDYLGVLNAGATIRVAQSAGKYVGDNMTGGVIVVQGNADYGAGQYCYGGTLVVHGNAGNFTATMNKGATIIVNGNVGDEVGTYMLKGDLVIVGDAGKNFANYLIRGSVYIGGKWASIGNNTKVVPLTEDDKAKLRKYFESYEIKADPAAFKKVVAASEKPFYN